MIWLINDLSFIEQDFKKSRVKYVFQEIQSVTVVETDRRNSYEILVTF